jgi:hypothetical protein
LPIPKYFKIKNKTTPPDINNFLLKFLMKLERKKNKKIKINRKKKGTIPKVDGSTKRIISNNEMKQTKGKKMLDKLIFIFFGSSL